MEQLSARRSRRRTTRRVRFAVLAMAVIVGTASGTYGLITLFRPSQLTPSIRPSPAGNGAVAFLTDTSLTSGPTPTIHEVPIWSMTPDGTGLHRLRKGLLDATALAWSPDGRQLAVTQSDADAALSVMSADGSALRVLAQGGDNVQAVGPSWSPDGRFLTFSMTRGILPFEIYRIGADGRGLVQLTHCSGKGCSGREWGAVASSWSPDSHDIVFERDFALYLMDSEGGHPSLLARCPKTSCTYEHPSWSPDGSRILYLRENPKTFWTIRPDGTGKRRVYDCRRPKCLAILFPTWSPDATQILFTFFSAPLTSQVAVIDAYGSHFRLLTKPSLKACCAAWQPLLGDASPSLSPRPTGSSSDAKRFESVIGPHCNLSSRSGDFDGDGTIDKALAFVASSDCPSKYEAEAAPHRLVVMFGSGRRYQRPLEECDDTCSLLAASDLNGDGANEMALDTSLGASVNIFLLLGWSHDMMSPLELQPSVASKGPSQAVVFDWGGSVTHQDYFVCRSAHDGVGVIDVISAQNYDQNNVTWKVKRTRMAFDGMSFRIVGIHHFSSPVKERNDPIESGDFPPPDLCGTR